MIKLSPNTKKSSKQKKALQYMREIAYARNKLKRIGYMHDIKGATLGKKIFSEFIEHYTAESLNLTLAPNINQKGWDAKDKYGKKYQIKETTLSEPQVKNRKFDYLITVRLNKKDFSISKISIFPKAVVLNKKNLGKQGEFRSGRKEFTKFICYKDGEWIRTETQNQER